MQTFLQQLAHELVQKHRLTAAGIGVSCNQRTEFAVAGRRRHKTGLPVTVDDRWHIGSITKSFTATLIARMVEAQALSFDARLPDLLPDIPMHDSWRACELAHLLTHTAGLPANFALSVLRARPDSDDALLAARRGAVSTVLARKTKWPCGSRFRYSNVGYTIAGHIAESLEVRRSEGSKQCEPYETLLSERVLEPLNLASSGFGAPVGRTEADEPMGHLALLGFRKAVSPHDDQSDNSSVISAAGRLHMTIEDLLRYGEMHLEGELSGNRFLSAPTWQRLHTPVLQDYGYGWICHQREWAGGRVIWHNGSNRMWYALIMVLPELDTVMAFVTNNGSILKADRAFALAAERIAGEIH